MAGRDDALPQVEYEGYSEDGAVGASNLDRERVRVGVVHGPRARGESEFSVPKYHKVTEPVEFKYLAGVPAQAVEGKDTI